MILIVQAFASKAIWDNMCSDLLSEAKFIPSFIRLFIYSFKMQIFLEYLINVKEILSKYTSFVIGNGLIWSSEK